MPEVDRRAEASALVRALLERLEREDLTELAITKADLRVRVRRDDRSVAPSAPRVADAATSPSERGGEDPVVPSEVVTVKAPLSGIFYRGPSSQAAPYVQVGGTVAVGQVIGLIEAMKLFNEIRSSAAGRVRQIIAESGQFVRAQTPLIEVEAV